MTRATQRLWLAGLAGLGLVLALIWLWPGPRIATLPPARVAAAVQEGAVSRDTETWSQTVLERPLFSTGRKPPRSANRGPVTVSGTMPRLSGVIIAASGKRAFFTPDGGGKPLVLTEGASIEDQTIVQILPGRVRLRGPKGDTELTVLLDHNRSGVIQTTPQPAPATPPFQNIPNFANPAFPNGFPNPNFRPFQGQPPLPPGGVPPPVQPPDGAPAESTDDAQPTPQTPTNDRSD